MIDPLKRRKERALKPETIDAIDTLIRNADAVLAPLGYYGSIQARDDRVSAFCEALERLRALGTGGTK